MPTKPWSVPEVSRSPPLPHSKTTHAQPPPPDSTNLPAWANWIAQDADGTWWAYEAEPNQHDHGWYENEVGRSARLHRDSPNPNWPKALRRLDRNSRSP